MLHKKHILFLLFITSICSFSQGGWKKKYSLQNSLTSVCRNVIEAPNGNLIMIGLTYDTINNPGTNRLTIVGTDAAGNMLWRKDYGRKAFEYLDNILAPEGAVVYDQNYFYHTLGVRDSNNKYIGVLLKFDYNGDTLWQRVYRDPAQDVIPQAICKSVDGGFIITGSFQNWANNTNPVLLLKTDINGKELWRKAINKTPPNVHDGKSIVQDSISKKVIIAGYQYIGANSDTHSSLIICDSLGNKLIQINFIGQNGGASIFGKVIQLRDKKFLSAGILNANNDIGALTRYNALLVKFDTNANIVWSKTYDTVSPFISSSSIAELSNGDIILATGIDTSINYNINGPAIMAIHKLDKDGNKIWKRHIGSAYTYTDSEYPRSMNPTQNNGFVLASYLFRSPSLPARPYSIVKIDSTGCDTLEAYCKWVESLGISELYKLRGFDLDLFPNPARSFVNIKVGAEQGKVFTIKLSDAEGRELETKELRGGETLPLNTAGYASGIYFISLEQGQKTLRIRKLVIIK